LDVGEGLEKLEEAKRWLAQARRDLKAARDSLSAGNYEWACFQAHQAAEKGLKALFHGLGEGAWGHSLTSLLETLSRTYPDPQALLTRARELGRHYIPSRHPSAFESGYPGMYYDEETASRAIEHAGVILKWAEEKLGELGLGG